MSLYTHNSKFNLNQNPHLIVYRNRRHYSKVHIEPRKTQRAKTIQREKKMQQGLTFQIF